MAGPQTTLVIRSLDKVDKLDNLMRTLPQELQDDILDYHLTDVQEVVTITRNHRPPLQLAIDRATRQTFAKVSYAQSTFLFPLVAPDENTSSTFRFLAWIESLADDHAVLIKRIRLVIELQLFIASSDWRCLFYRAAAPQYRFQEDPPGRNHGTCGTYKLILQPNPYVVERMVEETKIEEVRQILTQLRARVEPM